jgi:hypothetical protein
VDEFLQRRHISATTVAMLLRHGTTNSHPVRFQRSCGVNPQLGKAVRPGQSFNRRPTGLLGRTFAASIDAAAAHDVVPG